MNCPHTSIEVRKPPLSVRCKNCLILFELVDHKPRHSLQVGVGKTGALLFFSRSSKQKHKFTFHDFGEMEKRDRDNVMTPKLIGFEVTGF